jgi:NAD(P)H-dependent FMN reductase
MKDTSAMIRVVAISGSLRRKSTNTSLLRAAKQVAPRGMEVVFYEGLASLPHFNPDLDTGEEPVHPAVAELRALLAAADGFVISSPEYAHGVPGSLKNALDWIVSSNELSRKPIVLINASGTGGEKVNALLTDTLEIMEGVVLQEASILTPFARQKIDAEGNVTDPEFVARLRASMEALAHAIAHD